MRRREYRVAQKEIWTGLATTIALLIAAAAPADQVTSKGTVLRGKITGVGSSGITFEPEYGKGVLTIKWEDVEDLSTDGNFQVLYGEDEESDTALAGFAGLTMPLLDPIAAKFSVLDEYDNPPTAGTTRNSLFIDIGLSLVW